MSEFLKRLRETKSPKLKPTPIGKCKWCGSDNGCWTSIYDWKCHDCGKVTID